MYDPSVGTRFIQLNYNIMYIPTFDVKFALF